MQQGKPLQVVQSSGELVEAIVVQDEGLEGHEVGGAGGECSQAVVGESKRLEV